MCECIKRILTALEEKGYKNATAPIEFLSGKTYSDFYYDKPTRGGKFSHKAVPVLNSFCPFCGEKIIEKSRDTNK